MKTPAVLSEIAQLSMRDRGEQVMNFLRRNYFHPYVAGYVVPCKSRWPSSGYVRRVLHRGEMLYHELSNLVLVRDRNALLPYAQRFRDNKRRMLAITDLAAHKRYARPIIEFPPFFDSLSIALGSELAEYTVDESPLGSGGYGDVYCARKNGDTVALKVFRHSMMVPQADRENQSVQIVQIHQNLTVSKSLFSQQPFIPLLAIPQFPRRGIFRNMWTADLLVVP